MQKLNFRILLFRVVVKNIAQHLGEFLCFKCNHLKAKLHQKKVIRCLLSLMLGLKAAQPFNHSFRDLFPFLKLDSCEVMPGTIIMETYSSIFVVCSKKTKTFLNCRMFQVQTNSNEITSEFGSSPEHQPTKEFQGFWK